MTDNQEFDEIYKKYKNRVLRTAYRYSQNKDIAEDVLQDTFMALYRDMKVKGYTSADDYTNLDAWLYTTAKHAALNYGRLRSREVLAFDSEEELLITEKLTTESVESKYVGMLDDEERRQLNERVLSGLLAKNPRWYEMIRLVCGMELSKKEAAERMNISPDLLYVTLHRARVWIKETYGVEYEELNRY
ncbi:MAG: sigma-70 family RNA polymerase sigma factor [Schaedlerella sp.]|nr:sigma-70 family RNA polymerase sigma factor [Lachnospiraceae bacterium]MDY4202206.1 sigma-70 family RNA polymerase sigma factor [Schaedlerella sp.]